MTEYCFDVVVVGGGVMGCSVAYHLATLSNGKLSIAVVEMDSTYSRASSALSLSSIRQQFATPVNIELSRYTLEWLRQPSLIAEATECIDFGFMERGYLFLGREADVDALTAANAVQCENGVDVELIRDESIPDRFPWLVTDDLAIASFGRRDEGWFDGYSLLRGLRAAARARGVSFFEDEVRRVDRTGHSIVGVSLKSGIAITCGELVNAAGPRAGTFAALAGVEIPVKAQKRYVFVIDAPAADPSWPLVIDPEGFYFRPEGHTFLAGSPAPEAYHEPDDFEVDYAVFDEYLWPALAARAPAFEAIKLKGAWAGHYEMNIIDGNAIIGPVPSLSNFWLINGFSGHGLQHAPAAGRGLAELMLFGHYRSIDLATLGYDRLSLRAGLRETQVI